MEKCWHIYTPLRWIVVTPIIEKKNDFDYTELNDEISKDDYNLSEDVLHTLTFEELRLCLQKLPDKDQEYFNLSLSETNDIQRESSTNHKWK